MTVTRVGSFEGSDVHEAVLTAPGGAVAKVMSYGATLRDLSVPAKDGPRQVALGFPTFDPYPQHAPHFGATAGRYANRIAGGKFTLDGKTYQLPLNQANRHSLHGGGKGFGKRNWTLVHAAADRAVLALVSPDGEAGYPGTLTATCLYRLTVNAAGQVVFGTELTATTDAPTVVNLCHHSYWNLDGSPDILDHELMLRANLITPVDADLIPNGALSPVNGTPFDFRTARPIRHMSADGARFWYDHNYMLRRDRREPSTAAGLEVAHAATLRSLKNGLAMEVWTTEPAMQLYDGQGMKPPVAGHHGGLYGPCAGIAMEPQHVPDSPNLPHFPSTVLRPGEVYRQVTEYRFS
jgi:aldose 1-epimerase